MKNKKILKLSSMMIILFSTLILSSCQSKRTQEVVKITNSIDHYGEAVITTPQREALNNPYNDTGIIKTNKYTGMTKKMEVYGLTFFAKDSISDDFMLKIAKIYKEMFPKLTGENAKLQAKILENNHIYKACLPIVLESEMESIPSQLINDYSVCDIIMKVDQNQTMEVCEHLLHATSDVGLRYTLPKQFNFSQTSDISKVMNDAISRNYYKTNSYSNIKKDNKETYNRIIVQEFTYWLITSEWNIQEKYGPHEKEWTLLTSNSIKSKLPSGDVLYNSTINKLMQAPSSATLAELNN